MGLFKDIISVVSGGLFASPKVLGGVSKFVAPFLQAAQPLLQAAQPFIQQAIAIKTGGLLGGFGGAGGAGGAAAVGQFAQLGQRPPLGFLGAQSPFANPIARAQFFPPFNPATIPARPLTFQNFQRSAFQQQQFGGFGQTTSFNQGAFGQTVGPSFRPFASSFRSGGFGFSGGFRPGFSRSLAPQFPQQFAPQFQQQQFAPQFQQQFAQPRVSGFGGFGGFGRFGGFGGFF